MNKWLVVGTALAALAVGCAGPGGRSEGIIVRSVDVMNPIVGVAPATGKYGLVVDQSKDQRPIVTYNLTAGDKLGFEYEGGSGATRGDGTPAIMYAVAGDARFPLRATREYVWRRLSK